MLPLRRNYIEVCVYMYVHIYTSVSQQNRKTWTTVEGLFSFVASLSHMVTISHMGLFRFKLIKIQ